MHQPHPVPSQNNSGRFGRAVVEAHQAQSPSAKARILPTADDGRNFVRRSERIIADIDAVLNVNTHYLLDARQRVTQELASCKLHHQLRADPLIPRHLPLLVAFAPQWGLLLHLAAQCAPRNVWANLQRWWSKQDSQRDTQSPERLSQGQSPIYPLIFIKSLSHVFRELSFRENYLFVKYYGPPQLANTCTLRNLTGLLKNPGDAAQLAKIISRLCGYSSNHAPDARPRAPKAIATAGPLKVRTVQEGCLLLGDYYGLRIPVGSFRHTYAFFEQVQQQIERGEYQGACFVLSGRIHPDFMVWVYGTGKNQLGPVPDVEICYRLPLPSGANYYFTLKEARRFSARPANEPQTWSEHDHQVVRAMAQYFSNAPHRRSFDILTHMQLEHFPPDTRALAEHPLEIDTFVDLARFHNAWSESIHSTVLGNVEDPRITYRRDPWLNTEYARYEFFLERLRDRLIHMPGEQTFFAPEELTLKPDDQRRFLHHYAKKLFAVCEEERARCRAEEADPTIHQARVALGYDGPPEGFPLPLDYMIMDMILDMTRFDTYRASKAKSKSIDPSQVRVPVRLGRSYQHPEWFLRADQIRDVLDQLPPQRTIEILLEDPLADPPYQHYPSAHIHDLPEVLHATNLARLAEALVRCRERVREDPGIANWEAMTDRVGEMTQKIKGEEETFETACSNRAHRMKRAEQQFAGQSAYRALMHAAREECNVHVHQALEKLRETRELLLEMYRAYMPGIFESTCVRIHGISDTEDVVFIYSIGSRTEPIFACTALDFKRCHSESLGGKNMYGGGELRFSRHHMNFVRYEQWAAFDRAYRASTVRPSWQPSYLDDGSGHYEPGFSTLPFSRNIIVPLLVEQGFDVDNLVVGDALAPHTRMRGMLYDFERVRGKRR